MRTRALWMLGLALLLAGAAVFLARNWLEGQIQEAANVEQQQQQIPTTTVVVAAAKLDFGSNILREHLREVDWPPGSVPQGAFHKIDEIIPEGETRVALRSIEINEPILPSKVSGLGGRASLSTLIAKGMRATTIRVNDVNGVAGFVLPGDRVDILLTRERSKEDLITDILLQNVRVLGIDQDANDNRDQPAVVKAVTLEVTTEQAQKLTLAQRLGVLSLALRNIENTEPEKTKTVSSRDLLIGEAIVAPAPKDQDGRVVATRGRKATREVVKTKAVPTKQRSSVRIVRGLAVTEYDVQPERRGLAPPSVPRPRTILPQRLTPVKPPVLAPDGGKNVQLLQKPAEPGGVVEDEDGVGLRGLFQPAAPTNLLRRKIGNAELGR